MKARAVFHGVLMAAVLAAASSYGSFDRPVRVAGPEEVKFYEPKLARGIRGVFYNIRDGVFGMVENAWQLGCGLAACAYIPPGKAMVFAGDMAGLVDDNIFVRPMLRGMVSDMIEELSYYPFRAAKGIMLMSHELDDIAIVADHGEYVSDTAAFKTRLYLRPWMVYIVPGTVFGDAVIRPIGNIAKIFSLRRFTDMKIEDVPDQIDAFGLKFIRGAYNQRMFLLLPAEDEPDLRVYTEEEVSGVKMPGLMGRPGQ
ncbi:hypothetical protein FJY63_07955 [Candidatus Sumerlaeota bacterium]|nr:hypothetical protein [Candidatus Sumerlaeota bacterium]